MKANLYYFIFFFVLSNLTAHSQVSLPRPLNYQIKFSPLALIDPGSPVIQVGGQSLLQENLAASLELGIPYPGLINAILKHKGPLKDRHQFFKVRTEFKYLFKLKRNWFGIGPLGRNYLGFENFLIPMSYRDPNGYIYQDNKSYKYEYSDIKKNILGACFKFGREVPIGNSLILDNFCGIGVRRVKIKHKAVGLVEEVPYEEADFGSGFGSEREVGVFYRLHLAWGFKLGYIINN